MDSAWERLLPLYAGGNPVVHISEDKVRAEEHFGESGQWIHSCGDGLFISEVRKGSYQSMVMA
jgi:hypothetical protein